MNRELIVKQIEREVSKCARCGACRHLCPVYSEENMEKTSPRGKNSLLMLFLKEGGSVDEMGKILESCTVCEACVEGCPNEVHTYKIVLLGRSLVEKSKLEKEAYAIFNRNSLLKTGERVISVLQSKLMIKEGDLYRLRWRIGGIDKYLPQIPDKDFFSYYSELPDQGKFEKKVLFFTGCLIRYLYPLTGVHLVEIMNHYGWGVIAPEEQICCGLPALSSGFMDEFLESMEHNVRLFNRYKINHIISACGSCENTLKNYYREFAEFSTLSAEEIRVFSERIMDVSEFMLQVIGVDRDIFPSPEKVTYHDSCHLNRGIGVREAPRALLRNAGRFVEMREADVCCGFGGSFSVKQYETSQKILQRKMRNVEETGAEYLVAECPGCILQLNEGKEKYLSGELKVRHLVDYIYEKLFLK